MTERPHCVRAGPIRRLATTEPNFYGDGTQYVMPDSQGELRELPRGLAFFELADLDLADAEAVIAFTEDYGCLAPTGDDMRVDLPHRDATLWWEMLQRHSHALGRDYGPRQTSLDHPMRGGAWVHSGDPAEDDRRRRRAFEEDLWKAGAFYERRVSPAREGFVHVDEITYRAMILRKLVAHISAAQAGRPLGGIWQSAEDADLMAWQSFHEFAAAALSGMPAAVTVEVNGELAHESRQPTTSLYAAVVRQVLDRAAEGSLGECIECSRVFDYQRGRSNYDQNRRSGVDYCTTTCGNRARQNRRRRRLREAGQ